MMMKKHMKMVVSLFTVLLLTITFVSGQALTIDKIKTEPLSVNTGFSFKFHSTLLNEDRTIMISLPDGYDGNKGKYPVIYLLDGQWGFNPASQAMGWLSYSYEGKIPKAIIVGINTADNRENCMTPTKNKENNLGGGADQLYQFIKEELIPFIDANYRTYNYRVLCGGSIAGVFVIHAFITDPQLFAAYLAFSPSMWWDNRIMLSRTDDFLLKNPNLHNRLFISVANEGLGMGVDSLATILKKYSSNGLIWKFNKYPDETHATGSYKGIWDGFKFIFADWSYPFVDFGTKEHLFSPRDSVKHVAVTHKIVKLSNEVIDNYCGLFLDSYGRILELSRKDNTLLFSDNRLPMVSLKPESEKRFFIEDTDVQNVFCLNGYDIQFEFVKDDSLNVTANGNIEYTAKKVKHPPLVKLSDAVLERYVGTYLPSDQTTTIHITKEGNILKLSEQTFLSYLYPTGENKFFSFIDGSGYDVEITKDDSIIVSANGEVEFSAKKDKTVK